MDSQLLIIKRQLLFLLTKQSIWQYADSNFNEDMICPVYYVADTVFLKCSFSSPGE